MHAEQSHLSGWELHHIQFDLGDEGECTLGTGNQFTEIEGRSAGCKRCGFQQHIDGIARIAAFYGRGWEFFTDLYLVIVLTQHGADLPINGGFQRIAFAFFMESIDVQFFEFHFRSIAEEGFDRQKMFARTSVYYRVGAAGIVTHHATDHGAVGGRRFRTKE